MKRPLLLLMLLFCLPFLALSQNTDTLTQKTSLDTLVQKFSKLQKIIDKMPQISGCLNLNYEYSDLGEGFNRFDVRRARLALKGDIIPSLEYGLQVELAHNPALLDAYARWKPLSYLNLQVGQFKIPFTLENQYSPITLETVDNSQIIRSLVGYPGSGGRDIGMMLFGGFCKSKKGFDYFNYYAGIFNGGGIYNIKVPKRKTLIGTLSFHPIKEVTIEGSYYNGAMMLNDKQSMVSRVAASLRYEGERLMLRSEYISGDTDGSKGQGVYVTGGYRFWKKRLQGVVKYDFYQADNKVIDTRSTNYTAGLNVVVYKKSSLQLNYIYKDSRSLGASNMFVSQLNVVF